ncbi:hypothetical protein [Cohnella silvisoli]|uniref:Uncharacterized protein n=1 Tax=Cohnella silvisoli TaxID=2873699 RepID=A0ABV1KXX0_9BACL|nr:hypothetical protein [Cohnella silvisoli]MCD9021871.1 hypothetical protein [Cohnella silvisoli]
MAEEIRGMALERMESENQFQKRTDSANLQDVNFLKFRRQWGKTRISVCPIRPSG